ncbi:MAG: YibE/F family protein [Caldisericia bacterium]|nr:YibE/F family protein [Caldisericia bacterium]
MMKKLIPIFILTVVGIGFVLSAHAFFLKTPPSNNNNASHEIYEKASILHIEDPTENKETYLLEQKVTLRIRTGTYKGQEIRTNHHYSGVPGLDLELEVGDTVLLYMDIQDNELQEIYIADMYRMDWTLFILLLFVSLLLVVGGWKGFKSLIALGFTILAIFEILIPAIVMGYNPLFITIFIASFVTVFTMMMIAGFTTKSLSATLGTVTGVVVAGYLALLIGNLAHLTGVSSEECRSILLSPTLTVDLKGLLFAGILIGALGAIMDVSMSIASSLQEIYKAKPSSSIKELFIAGMNVGKDIMGTMSNTLILAYTGGSLPLLFMYAAYEISFIKIVNLELISAEIIRAIVGSIGLIMSVPLTSIVSSILYITFPSKERSNQALNNTSE